jgi:hypothetical protein
MKIRFFGGQVFPCGGGRTYIQTDTTNLIVAFRNLGQNLNNFGRAILLSEQRRRPHLILSPNVVMNCPPLIEHLLFISNVSGEDTVTYLRDPNR